MKNMKRIYLLILSIFLFTIVIYAQPCSVPNAGNDTTVCSHYLRFSASSLSSEAIYHWTCITRPAGANLPNFDNAYLLNATVTTDGTYGIYTFVLSESNMSLSCTEYDTIQVTFMQPPDNQFSVTSADCAGTPITVTYLGDASLYAPGNFIWNFDNANIITGSGAGPFQIVWNNGGNHQISLIMSNGTCLSERNIQSVEAPTKIKNTITKQNTTCNICNGEINIVTEGGVAPYNYLWSNGETTRSLRNLCSGVYYLTTTDLKGCFIIDTVKIESSGVFSIITSINDTICKGQDFTLQAEVVSGNSEQYDFLWRDDYGNKCDTNIWRVFPSHTTTYYLTVSDPTGCSVVADPVTIAVGELPKAIFSIEPTIISSECSTINFRNSSENATKYFWDFGDGETSTAFIPSHKFDLSNEEYTVCLTVENEYHCEYKTCADIPVYVFLSFYVPTFFSPNGDGLNDCFRPCGTLIDPTTFSMTIFDRFGNLVFKTNEYFYDDIEATCDNCYEQPGAWNGKRHNNGDILPNGVYTWYISFVGIDGIARKENGVVTLLK